MSKKMVYAVLRNSRVIGGDSFRFFIEGVFETEYLATQYAQKYSQKYFPDTLHIVTQEVHNSLNSIELIRKERIRQEVINRLSQEEKEALGLI